MKKVQYRLVPFIWQKRKKTNFKNETKRMLNLNYKSALFWGGSVCAGMVAQFRRNNHANHP